MNHDHEQQREGELPLEPMERLDLAAHDTTSELLRALGKTAFSARSLGEAADVAEQMIRDDAWVVLTLSGAMTMAGLSLLVVEMIERGWVNCLISTGALVGHGLTEDIGLKHYKADPSIPDAEYFKRRLNRVYDVIEPEENLDQLENVVRDLLRDLAETRGEPLGTHELLALLGERLPGRGVLQAAHSNGVPVFIPAFTDSELGLDFAVFNSLQRRDGRPGLTYDGFRDLEQYAELSRARAHERRTVGIFTIGGGVPRNWAQQVAPFIDICNSRLGQSGPVPRFRYGIRICPDPVHYGHLSGSTYSEGVSWGKFVPVAEGGRFAEVPLDATVAWPLIVRALIERGL
jgi:deoxyhypusine synthase